MLRGRNAEWHLDLVLVQGQNGAALANHRPDPISFDLIDDIKPPICHSPMVFIWSPYGLVRSIKLVGAIGFHEYQV